MPYDPRPANAARLKMFHLIADKIERNPDCLQTRFYNVFALEPLDLTLHVEETRSR